MNKRQKIVQAQFLNNEEAVLKRLKQVYGQSLKDITTKAQELQNQILGLQAALGTVEDAAEQERLKSMIQSKVYQRDYQNALKKQVGSILDNMQVEEFKTVSDYLQKCYEDGFIGTMFDLQGQGIPLCFPLDQEAMVRAVQLDSKISNGLYSRLGEDVAMLKKKITAQVSRGISTGMSYQQVAQQLSAYTNIGYNNAVRIARTEGHRIQVQGAMDACYKAKDKGADVVKQWDATLDDRTRDSHAQVDGEIRELDKPFSNKLMFPGDPSGGAAEVVNCRCALLQRARWALDAEELETLKKRAEFFGLDKAETFDDYKKQYLKAAEQIKQEESKTNLEKLSDRLARCKKTEEVSLECQDYFRQKGSKIKTVDFGKSNVDAAKEMAEMLDRLDDTYESSLISLRIQWMPDSKGGMATPTDASFAKFLKTGNPLDLESEITLNETFLRSKKAIMHDFESNRRSKYGGVAHGVMSDERYAAVTSLVHEYGHTICPGKANEIYQSETGKANPSFMPFKRQYNMYMRSLRDKASEAQKVRESFAGKPDGLALGIEAAKELQAEYDSMCISHYSKASIGEFIAEGFCDALLSSNPKPASVKVLESIKKIYGKGK